MDDFLDGRPPFKEAFGNPDSSDDMRRVAGVLKDSRKQVIIAGVLKGGSDDQPLPDHSFSLTTHLGVVFRSTADLCAEIGVLPESGEDEQKVHENLRKVIVWTINEIGGLKISGKRITDGEVAMIERDLPNTPIMIGVRNGIFLEYNPTVGRQYLLDSTENIQVLPEQEIIKIIYEVATKTATEKGRDFYNKLLMDPESDPLITVDLGAGAERLRLRQILAYYVYRNHAATRSRTMTHEFVKENAEVIVDFIGRPHTNFNRVIGKIRVSLMAMSSPAVAGALDDCYYKTREEKKDKQVS